MPLQSKVELYRNIGTHGDKANPDNSAYTYKNYLAGPDGVLWKNCKL